MDKIEKDLIDAVREHKLFDYISQNYYNMTVSQLADVIKELDYAMHKEVLPSEYSVVMENAACELEDRWD